GGFLEAGELPERGLRRELREELGASATVTRLLGFYRDRYGPGGVPLLAVVYVVRLRGAATARSDVAEVRWFRPEAIPWRSIAFPAIRQALRDHLKGAGAARPRRRAPARRASPA